MVLEHEIPKFIDWLLPALIQFLATIALLTVVGTFFGFVRKAIQIGPGEAFYAVAQVFAAAVRDVRDFSLRRTFAMARLAIQEAIRRRVIVVIAVFLVVLLFAGWFLDVKSDHPATVYISFVLTATNYLVLPLALFLAAFSLPNEIKSRIIYTIVTKPVRPSEIVLGRILGFTMVGTAILAVMCLVSYLFVDRGLRHRHELDPDSVVAAVPGKSGGSLTGVTTQDAHHRHEFTVGPDGTGRTNIELDHWHEVTRDGEGSDAKYTFGPPIGDLQARVPIYGKLKFFDREGNEGAGVNVGHEWMYRSYVEGNTLASASWTFSGLNEQEFPDGLPLELTLRVFRTHKGNIERGVNGAIRVKNPDIGAKIKESTEFNFTAKEFVTDQQFIPRKLKARDKDGTLKEVDLFEDLMSNGEVQISIRCLDGGQYYGMAQADVWVRAADRSFFWNFVKGYLGIWMQMLMVTCFGVMFSTFLNGAVAMIATIGSVVLGFFGKFVAQISSGELVGGGPIESLIKILTQASISVDLEANRFVVSAVKWIDWLLLYIMQLCANLLPDYSTFDTVANVAYGFDIQPDLMAAQLVRSLGYFMVVTGVAYFCFKTREVAA